MRRCRALWAAFAILSVSAAAYGDSWVEDIHSGLGRGECRGVFVSDQIGGLGLSFAGRNLLSDPGFETAPDKCPQMQDPYGKKPRAPLGWEHNGLTGQEGALRPSAVVRSGAGAWELVDTIPRGEPALLQFVPFKPEYRGMQFAFEVWARTSGQTNIQACIALKFRSGTHWRQDVSRNIVVEPAWKAYSIMAVVPQDADELGVVIGPSSYEGQGSLIVDDASLVPAAYGPRGVYVSSPHDMGRPDSVVWRAAFQALTPEGTSASLSVRTGNSPTPDAGWSAWGRADAGQHALSRLGKGRFVQYQLDLASTRSDVSPVVRKVELHYGARLGFVEGRLTHARTGAPVADALVTLNGVSVATGPAGDYVAGVSAGEIKGTAAALHYMPSHIGPLSVKEDARVRLDVKLAPDPSWPMFRRGPQRHGFSALSGSLEGFGVAWRHALGTVGGGQTLPADLDGDGRCELVIARGGSVFARRLNGELIWETRGWEIGSIMGVYDLLGNGDKQVVGLSAGWQPYANGAFTVLNGRDGKLLCRVDTWPDAGDIGHGDTKDYLHGGFSPLQASSCVVADLDGDGRLEIVAHPHYHSALMAFQFPDGLTAPKMMWKTRDRFKYDLYCYPILSADVDGDGKPEIVFHDNDMIRIFEGRTGLEKSAANMGCLGGLFGLMACADVDGDGKAEVVLLPNYKPTYQRNTVALAGWDGKALVRRWSRDFEHPVSAPSFTAPQISPFADIDGDGKLEVVVQAGPDVVILGGADGAEKNRIAQAALRGAADLDRDGATELVVAQGDTRIVYNGKGGFGPKPIAYPADWGWQDWGAGELLRLRGAEDGKVEVVNQKGDVPRPWHRQERGVRGVVPGAPYITSPVVADLDGDGRMEILVRDARGIIRVLDGSSNPPAQRPFPELKCDTPGDTSRGGGITVYDLDGDGKCELIFRQDKRLVVANHDGSARFKSEQGGLHFPVVGRFDGDGVRDIACYADRRWMAFSGKDGKLIWEAEAPESNEVATWDVNGDGRDEITGKMGPVFLLNGADGKLLWTAFRREQCALGLGTFADLDGDGAMEILISGEYTNTAWYPDGRPMWWIGWSAGGAKEHYGAVAGVNGALSFALSSNHGILYCVDGRTARQLWTFAIPEKVSLSHCAAADLDGDGRPEFVFGTNTGKLFIVNGEDGSPAKVIEFGHPVGEPVVADVDGDGLADVLVVSDGVLCCLKAGAKAR